MNIFVLSTDPKEAARFHCDKHVVKMILETGQMLCTAHWLGWLHDLGPVPVKGTKAVSDWLRERIPVDSMPPWRMTHVNHPCTQWAYKSFENYMWLHSLGVELCAEYTLRYKKTHKSEGVYRWLKANRPRSFPESGQTPFAIAMFDDCKVSSDPVVCYRKYYSVHKRRMAKWKTKEPAWFNSSCETSCAG